MSTSFEGEIGKGFRALVVFQDSAVSAPVRALFHEVHNGFLNFRTEVAVWRVSLADVVQVLVELTGLGVESH